MTHRIAVVGSRGFDIFPLMCYVLDIYYAEYDGDIEIVSGGAPGADKLSELYATKRELETKIFSADWDRLGKRAGYVRNVDIVDYCDEVVAFWDEKSRGTQHTIWLGHRASKPTVVIKYEQYKGWNTYL